MNGMTPMGIHERAMHAPILLPPFRRSYRACEEIAITYKQTGEPSHERDPLQFGIRDGDKRSRSRMPCLGSSVRVYFAGELVRMAKTIGFHETGCLNGKDLTLQILNQNIG